MNNTRYILGLVIATAVLSVVSCEQDDAAPLQEGVCTPRNREAVGGFFLRSTLLNIDTLIVGCDADTILRDEYSDNYREEAGSYEYIATYTLDNVGAFGARWTFETFYIGPADSLQPIGGRPYYRDFVDRRDGVIEDSGLNVTCFLPDGRTFTTRPAESGALIQTTATSSTFSQGYFAARSDGEPRLPNVIGFSLSDELYAYQDSAGVSIAVDSAYVELNALNFDLQHLH